jgi:DNA-binding NtrC family response regulator
MDVATGSRVRLRYAAIVEEPASASRGMGTRIDWGLAPGGDHFEAWEQKCSPAIDSRISDLDLVLELLDQGCDGEPRLIALNANDAAGASALSRIIAREARRRGYVPMSTELFTRLRTSLADDLRNRALVLLEVRNASGVPGVGPSILAEAAALSSRPHLLVSILLNPVARSGLFAREARASYEAQVERDDINRPSPDSMRYLQNAAHAENVARAGRHAMAERMLRESAAALARRENLVAASRITLMLGRLLVLRGRTDAADVAFESAADFAKRSDRPGLVCEARIWSAHARIDAGAFVQAESLVRATRLGPFPDDRGLTQWADAALARCLMWQRRTAEAVELLTREDEPLLSSLPHSIYAAAVRVRVLVEAGRLNDAGRLARALLEATRNTRDRDCLIAETSHLRVLAMTGDLELVRERFVSVTELARTLHTPLDAIRARLIWIEALRLGGAHSDTRREIRRLSRLTGVLPMALRRHTHQLSIEHRPRPAPVAADETDLVLSLLANAHDEDDDRSCVQKMLERLATRLRASRVEVQTCDRNVMSTLLSSGIGLQPRLAARALEAGVSIGPEPVDGVPEAAALIAVGKRIIAALACRWPMGRDAPQGSASVLRTAGAIMSPRLDTILSARREISEAAAAIPELVGRSAAMDDLRRSVTRAANAPFAILIEGESGAGKELIARAIHHLSARRERRFCDVNCAALPEELIESELFGHARGAFTGALVDKPGLFEEANGGTLFFDELPDLSSRAQAKLLRVLQQSEVRRVGEAFSRKVDVRIVAATNRPMAEEVAQKRFRQDLLYRLDVIRIRIPPLRERPEDILVLARHFWKAASERTGTRAALSHAVLTELARYHWPGNVRELQNVISMLAVAAPARGVVRPVMLPPAIIGATPITAVRLAEARRQFERRYVEVALARASGSRTRAAVHLGLSRQGLLKLMTRLGMDAGSDAPRGKT